MRQRAVRLGQDRRGRIVTHRSNHFLAVFGHGRQHLFQLFDAVTCSNLTITQLRTFEQRLFWHISGQTIQVNNALDPFAKWLGSGQFVLQLFIMEQATFLHIHGNHLPRAKCAFLDNSGLINRHHANLGPSNQQAVTRHNIAQRTQTVAVQTTANPATIGHRQGSRAIPRLHNRVAIAVHVLPRLRHFNRLLRPRLWHHHCLCHGGIAARADQNFKDRIQGRGVRRARRDDRFDILSLIAERTGCHADFMALHPVDVAFQRVDFAVVGQHAERLGQ